MTLADYIQKKNGVPIGDSNSLRNNLYRSLGAKNFSTFWTYWNPIFGYFLGKKIFKPLKKTLPVSLSLVLTFIFCGLIHDAVTTLVRGEISLFFTIWFLFMGIGVLLSKTFNSNYSGKPWIFRAMINLSIIVSCLLITIYLNRFIL